MTRLEIAFRHRGRALSAVWHDGALEGTGAAALEAQAAALAGTHVALAGGFIGTDIHHLRDPYSTVEIAFMLDPGAEVTGDVEPIDGDEEGIIQ